jgi:hypothetical protein
MKFTPEQKNAAAEILEAQMDEFSLALRKATAGCVAVTIVSSTDDESPLPLVAISAATNPDAGRDHTSLVTTAILLAAKMMVKEMTDGGGKLMICRQDGSHMKELFEEAEYIAVPKEKSLG